MFKTSLLFFPLFLWSHLVAMMPIKTDTAIFLFDNGEKNFVSAVLEYAERCDLEALKELDFRIVFMGASLDAMSQEPFCRYSDKLIHYKDLGIEETIDRHWIRNQEISLESIQNLFRNLQIRKKAWVPVSCIPFRQIVEALQEHNVEVMALRDNPNPDGDTDYFNVAREVQNSAHKIAVPSQAAAEGVQQGKEVIIVGHPPIESWQKEAQSLDKAEVVKRLGLSLDFPVLVYAGVYGGFYEEAFTQFLKMVRSETFRSTKVQVVVVPHPRFQGVVERRLCLEDDGLLIAGEFEKTKLKTVEALAIADSVVTADATSTIVIQAKSLGKTVLYLNPRESRVSQSLCAKRLIQNPTDVQALVEATQQAFEGTTENLDVFQLLGIPKNGAQILWEAFKRV